MADPRNKFLKDEYWALVRQMQARLHPPRPAPEPIRCGCGLTYHQVEVMWAVQADRWSPLEVYCPACLPDGLKFNTKD